MREKILCIRIGRMGDIVMVLPAIFTLLQNNSKAVLYFVTSSDGNRIIKALQHPRIKVLVYRHQLIYRLVDTYKIVSYVKKHKFKEVYSFETKHRLNKYLPMHARLLPKLEQIVHYTQRCLDLVLNDNAKIKPQLHLPVAIKHSSEKKIIIGLHPSFSGYHKFGNMREKRNRLWHWQHFADLARRISAYAKVKNLDISIMMNLLPEEKLLGKKIVDACGGCVVLCAEKPNFKAYLAYLKSLKVLVAPNTGVMHLAASMGTPVVALFSGYDPKDCGPYDMKRNIVLESNDPKLGINAIAVDEVFASVISKLALV
jgi:heptosyltransferase I